jgi:hypothetical protein
VEQVSFALFFALFVAAWILSIGESIGMWHFWPRVYATGVRALHETRSLPLPALATGSEFETKSGKFKIISPELCLFRPHMGRGEVRRRAALMQQIPQQILEFELCREIAPTPIGVDHCPCPTVTANIPITAALEVRGDLR